MSEDKQYEIDVLFSDRSTEIFLIRGSTIRKKKNVIEYVQSICDGRIFNKILTRELGRERWELNFRSDFESWKNSGYRIEAENDPGYEDYTGYGNRTEGKQNRFYIGRSTGWIPIYLEILKSNSHGGSGLMWEHRKFKIVNYLNKGY